MQKQLLITFDYELFLGKRSGFVDESMIFPTKRLLKILNKYGIHSVFFIDTVYLLRLQEMALRNQSCKDDFNKISQQLCELVEQGHYVYPHIHPHWLDAEYLSDKNSWSLNNTSRYRFHKISFEDRNKIFDGSIHLLKSIIHPKFPSYLVNGHRAGGWCIQPFSDYKPFYEKHQIIYDFSVISGFYQFTDAQHFDFSKAPSKDIYKFNDDVCEEVPDGPFTQFNISSIEIGAMLNICNKLWLKMQYKLMNDHTFNRGIGQESKELPGFTPALPSGKNLGNSRWERISVELINSVKLTQYLRFLEKHPYMHFISHPKMITIHNLSIFDKFLEKAFKKYSIETDFHLMNP